MRKRKTIPLELRQKILAAYDKEKITRDAVARRFRISVGMVKKLLQLRRHGEDIGPGHHRAGRKPMIGETHQRKLRELLGRKPHLTLREMRDALGLECSVQAIHIVLGKMGLSSMKRRAMKSSKRSSSSPAPAKKSGKRPVRKRRA